MAEIRLIDANALKETMAEFMKNNIGIYSNEMFYLVDNAPTIKTYCYFCGQTEHGQIEERGEE